VAPVVVVGSGTESANQQTNDDKSLFHGHEVTKKEFISTLSGGVFHFQNGEL
jgi:hypothetical protein